MLKGFHSSFLAGKLQSAAASAVVFAGGGDEAVHFSAEFDHFHDASAVKKVGWLGFPGQGFVSFAFAPLAALLSVGGHRGIENGLSSLHEEHGAAADISDASLSTAQPDVALSMGGYCEDEICLEQMTHVVEIANADLAALKWMAENCTELQFASKQMSQSCCWMGIIY